MRTVRLWWDETVGGLPQAYWYLWANTLINRIGAFVIVLLALYLTRERGFSPAFAGFVLGLWGAGGAVGTLVGGVLADRLGRKPTFLIALYGGAAMTLVVGTVRHPVAIAISVLLLGIVSEAWRPSLTALMIDIVPDKDRLRAFSLNYWVVNLGFAFAATTAGLVAGMNFTMLFVIDATATVIGATVVAIKVKEPDRTRLTQTVAADSARPRPPGLREVFADKVFMAFVAVNLLSALIFMQHLSTLPISMARDGLSPSTYGSVIALNGLLIVAGQLFVPRLLRGLSRSAALAISTLILGIGFGINTFADTAPIYAVAVLIFTVGEMLNAPSNSTINAELSPASMRGRYQGVFSLSWAAAAFLGPVIGSATLQYASEATLWLGCLVLGTVAAAMHLLAGPARDRRTAELRAAELRVAELAAH